MTILCYFSCLLLLVSFVHNPEIQHSCSEVHEIVIKQFKQKLMGNLTCAVLAQFECNPYFHLRLFLYVIHG